MCPREACVPERGQRAFIPGKWHSRKGEEAKMHYLYRLVESNIDNRLWLSLKKYRYQIQRLVPCVEISVHGIISQLVLTEYLCLATISGRTTHSGHWDP